LRGTNISTADEGHQSQLTVTLTEYDVATGSQHPQDHTISASGNGPIEAFVNAMAEIGEEIEVLDYAEHALSSGQDAQAVSYVECNIGGQILWGVGIDNSTVTASFKAIVSAANRARR
ncbi:MAG: alpha-isopropylmalate synthase regulatory domain-containing protein, partial [Arcanobacterium sp.]|nr:alpha-isopropylmalate synthase regulatory domain-containing protein [Arcanobacterium sp.]